MHPVCKLVCTLSAAGCLVGACGPSTEVDPGDAAASGADARAWLAPSAEVDRLESDVLARFGAESLPSEPVRDAVRRWVAAQPQPPTPDAVRARRLALADAFVVAELVRREAAARGESLDDAAAWARLAPDTGGPAKVRARTGESEAELLTRLRTDALLDGWTAAPPPTVDVAAWRAAHPGAVGSDVPALAAMLTRAERMRRRVALIADLRARAVEEPLRQAIRAEDADAAARAADPRGRARPGLGRLGAPQAEVAP
ncbi:MAG: hypothetical protein U1F43_00745 [Myxococcota bacterium]